MFACARTLPRPAIILFPLTTKLVYGDLAPLLHAPDAPWSQLPPLAPTRSGSVTPHLSIWVCVKALLRCSLRLWPVLHPEMRFGNLLPRHPVVLSHVTSQIESCHHMPRIQIPHGTGRNICFKGSLAYRAELIVRIMGYVTINTEGLKRIV